jgi:hypothetical protein
MGHGFFGERGLKDAQHLHTYRQQMPSFFLEIEAKLRDIELF